MSSHFDELMKTLKPAIDKVANDSEFRELLEHDPLKALAQVGVDIDDETREALRGQRFSEFLAEKKAGDRVILADIPLDPALQAGALGGFAPPYVPIGNLRNTSTPGSPLDTSSK